MLAIQTRFLGPTNFRGSRVVASVMETARDGYSVRRTTLNWDDALGVEGNHRLAADALIGKLGWQHSGTWVIGSSDPGYVFVCCKAGDPAGADRLYRPDGSLRLNDNQW